jgi:hypothetical protein
MENATPVEQIPIPSELTVSSVETDSVKNVQTSTQEPAISVLKKKLDDLELRTKLLSGLDHPLIKQMEPTILDQIAKLTLEAVNQFLSSDNPGELPKKAKKEKLETGHGTVSRVT